MYAKLTTVLTHNGSRAKESPQVPPGFTTSLMNTSLRTMSYSICLLVISIAWLTGCSAAMQSRPEGGYRGEIQTPGGPVVFGVAISWKQDQPNTTIRCGGQTWSISKTTWDGAQLVLDMPEFDAQIIAKPTGNNAWNGSYRRVRSADSTADLAFHMTPPLPDPPPGDATPFTGRFRLRFADSDSDAIAIFSAPSGGNVTGTILTTTGDYRYLGGSVDRSSNELQLSAFDGGHVFRITATASGDGSLSGDFWSGDWYHTTFTAKQDAAAKLPSGFGLSQVRDDQSLADLSFPNLNGDLRRLSDPALLGKMTIIELFGSWCPNCHDAADLLGQLQTEYGTNGLKIIGLAFELTGDANRDRAQVKRYMEHFDITYPILVAGLADKEKATEAFPLLQKIKAYPTFLFVDSSGNIKATYTGFSGPATGAAHQEMKRQFKQQIEMLLTL